MRRENKVNTANDLKSKLMDYLKNDDEVKQAIRDAINETLHVNDNHNKDLENQIEQLNGMISDITIENTELKREKTKLEKQLEVEEKKRKDAEDNLKEEQDKLIQAENKVVRISGDCELYKKKYIELSNDYDELKERYKINNDMYEKYINLGSDIFKRMERILNAPNEVSKSPEILMAYGLQENNIVALWDSIASNYDFYISCGKINDITDIFNYFFGLYKQISFKQITIKWPEIGNTYDERIHTRTVNSSAVGTIRKVILPAFSIGKNISRKALVEVQ